MEELLKIQCKLKVAKDKRNDFLKANFRSAEDILKAVKPLLEETKCVLTLSDDIVAIGNDYKHQKEWNKDNAKYGTKDVGKESYEGQRFYVKATATLTNSAGVQISTTAFAREDIEKAGVDVSQVTGSASSYARKYALNGLFALDDGKDEDVHPTINKQEVDEMAKEYEEVKAQIDACETRQQLIDLNDAHLRLANYAEYVERRNNKYKELPK